MERDIELIKDFLKNKVSYLREGNPKIQRFLSSKYNGRNFSFSDIRRAKKEVKRELKNLNKKNSSKIVKEAKIEATPEMLAKFNELAKMMGLEGLDSPEEEKDGLDSLLKRKKALKGFHTPDLKDQVGMHILLGCNHVPFHNKKLHRGIIELIKDYPELIKGFHLMGDFLDLNPLSSHDRGRFTAVKGLTLNDEYQIGSDLLHDFDMVLPKGTWKTYLYGNHEDRYNRWMGMMDNAKTPLISPEDGLRLWQKGYNVKTRWSQDFITIGNDFDIFHGIYFSIHNAKAHLDKLRRNCAYVHTHRIQNYREGEMAAYNIGACADFSSPAFNYATRPMKQQWSNGFAINMVDEKGRSNVTQIYANPDGSFWFGGKLY
jgi:uncharacterized protein (UPF0305 family)